MYVCPVYVCVCVCPVHVSSPYTTTNWYVPSSSYSSCTSDCNIICTVALSLGKLGPDASLAVYCSRAGRNSLSSQWVPTSPLSTWPKIPLTCDASRYVIVCDFTLPCTLCSSTSSSLRHAPRSRRLVLLRSILNCWIVRSHKSRSILIFANQ